MQCPPSHDWAPTCVNIPTLVLMSNHIFLLGGCFLIDSTELCLFHYGMSEYGLSTIMTT